MFTALASAAAVPVAGLLVRHRGFFATLVACGVLAIYPDSVLAARTVLLEPWLVLFCLLGALAVFDGDEITGSRRRLLLGGILFGFAGAVKVWAIIPVVVILALTARGRAGPPPTPPGSCWASACRCCRSRSPHRGPSTAA